MCPEQMDNERKPVGSELDRRVAERTRELAETNAELQLQVGLLQHLPVSAWTLKPDGTPDFVNQVWLEYSGQTLDFVRSHPEAWMNAVHPEDREKASKVFWDGVRSGQGFAMEARTLRARDLTYRWHLSQAVVLRDAEGKVLRFIGTTTDIDDQKHAQEELRASEASLRQIVDSIPGLVCTMDAAGEIQLLNQPLLKYFGKTSEELKGWKMTDAVHPDDLPEVIKAYTYAVTTGTPYDIEHRCRRADGVYRWFQVRALPMRDVEGHITGWYVLLTDIEDLKLAEEALKAGETKLRRIVDSIPGLVCVINPAGQIELANRQLMEYLNMTVEEMNAWETNGLVHPDDLQRMIVEFRHSMTAGTPFDDELRYRRSDGVYRWFKIRIHPVAGPEGRVAVWYSLLTDIDDRRRAEGALQASERKLTHIINTIPTTAWSARPDGYCDFLNQRWLDYAGFSAEQAQGWGWAAAIHPDDANGLREYWQSCLDSGAPVDTEARIRRFDGVYRWFLFRANPFRDESGNIVKWYGTNVDIEDRKRADEELRRSETFLEQALNVSSTGSFSWCVETDEIKWSKQLYQIFGIDEGTPLTPERVYSRVHPEDASILREMVEPAKRDGSNIAYEHRLLMPDHSVKYINTVAHGIRDANGRLEYIGAVQDVTARRLSEEALNKVRSELAHMTRVSSLGALTASIAHEVNQPIAGIVINAGTCLRALSSDPPNIDSAREATRRMIRDSNRVSEVIARLRALFSGKEFTAEPVDLNEAAREVIALCLDDLKRNRIILRQDLANDLPQVTGDRVQLQQVILNLLRNASDAMSGVEERPRELAIKTEKDESDCVRLTVQDTGLGVTGQDMERLFEAFYTTKSDGMGMGLSVSRSIIEHHRGRLWATPSDGPGATFSFSIPYELSSVAAIETSA